jgi:hypothetical protein
MTLTPENYFQDKEYFSVSRWKVFNKCEFQGVNPIEYNSTAMMVGSYVDAYVEGTLEKFKEEHPEIFSSKGATKGELKSDYKYANEICSYIDNDPVLQQFLSGEKQTVMTGEIGGVPFKIKIDSYSKGIAINDLKIMRSVTNYQGQYVDFITPWQYDVQLACYQEIVRQNTGETLPCFICAVTKESPIDSLIVALPQNMLDRALYMVESTIGRYYELSKGIDEPVRCERCDACRSTRKETPIISFEELMGDYNGL